MTTQTSETSDAEAKGDVTVAAKPVACACSTFAVHRGAGRARRVIIAVVVLAILVLGIRSGILSRARAEERLVHATTLAAVPSVAVV
jgi:hypothetical protein